MYDTIVSWAVTVAWQAWAMFAQAGAIFGAALVALRTARKILFERSLHRMSDVAEKALALTYQAEDTFRNLRNPMSYLSQEDLKKSFRERHAKEYQGRLDRSKAFFEECYDTLPVVRAYFGSDVAKNFREILLLRNRLIASIQSYLDLSEEDVRSDDLKSLLSRARADVFFMNDSDDFSLAVAAVVKALEDELAHVVRPAFKK